jgi:hypothetical protein
MEKDLKNKEVESTEEINTSSVEVITEEIIDAGDLDDGNADTQDFKKIDEERNQAEQEFKFVIIGGNEPAVNEHFVKAMKESGMPITVFELTTAEMKFIINSRAQVKAEETSVEYLQNEENKQRVNDWVKLLIERFLKATIHPKFLNETLQKALDGSVEVMFNKKDLKNCSQLSWSQFNELFSSLELFGVVKYDQNDRGKFSLVLKNEDILKNQMIEIKELIKLSLGKVISLNKNQTATAADKKRFKSLSTKLSNIVEKI